MLRLLQRLAAPPKQTLTTLQPTPSTVCYTVSTRTEPKTLPAVLGYYVSLVLRFLMGAIALLALLTKWELASGRKWIVSRVVDTGSEAWPVQTLQRLPSSYTICAAAVVLWLVLRRGYTEESFLILQGLGLQTSTSASTYLQSATTRFIPTTSVQDIFIHEAFKGFEVRFYLAVVVKGEEDVVVVFPTLLPRRQILEDVWRGSRACVFGSGHRKKVIEPEEPSKDVDDTQ